jgi:hypothetical protein
VRVGGLPVGIVVTRGRVWFADQKGGRVLRLDLHSLRRVGDPIRVGRKPSWLAVAGGLLFVTDQEDGTVARIDVKSGQKVGLPIRVSRPTRDAPAPSMAPIGGSVWVSSFASNTLTRIDSSAGRSDAGGSVRVRISGTNEGQHGDRVTNGGVAGIGHYVARGAVSDKGKVVVYRTVRGPLITLRNVAVGKKGTITFLVKIDTNAGTSRWTITSGTRAYGGLRGEGIESESSDFTVSTLTGTVSR